MTARCLNRDLEFGDHYTLGMSPNGKICNRIPCVIEPLLALTGEQNLGFVPASEIDHAIADQHLIEQIQAGSDRLRHAPIEGRT